MLNGVSREPSAFVLAGPAQIRAYQAAYSPLLTGLEKKSPASLLAETLASYNEWSGARRSAIVHREHPTPTVGLIGYFIDTECELLLKLTSQLRQTFDSIRVITYEKAERVCESLAQQLVERLGQNSIRAASYTAIPRGGSIILGMLSYILDLDQKQISQPINGEETSNSPLIVVDDCALTGQRFSRFLENCPAREVIFAPLFSPPELRRKIEAAEERVTACVSGADLQDRAPDFMGEDYDHWYDRWMQRLGGDRYWIGQPEHISFPWSEPDQGVWDNQNNRIRSGWSIAPASHCLEHRSRSEDSTSLPVQVQPDGKGLFSPADDVLFATFDDAVLVANTRTKNCYELSGTGAAMWKAILENETLPAAIDQIDRRYDASRQRLAEDLRSFVNSLVQRDLIC